MQDNNRQPDVNSDKRVPQRRKVKTIRLQKTRIRSSVDGVFLVLIVLLMCIGTIMVCSASYAYAQNQFDGDSLHFVRKQLWFVAGGLVVLGGVSLLDYVIVHKLSSFAFYVSLIMLGLVPILGENWNGATRWIEIGPIQLQPSEILKVTLVMYFADYNIRHRSKDSIFAKKIYAWCKNSRFEVLRNLRPPHQNRMKTFWTGIFPYVLFLGYVAILLWLQPHMSGLIIIGIETIIMMILGRCSWGWLTAGGFMAACAGAGMLLLKPHARTRIKTWLTPFDEMEYSFIRDNAWQPYQSVLAIGSGGLWGVGLGNSRQKHLFLPEPQNDYIFSILCEEMGFIFAAFVIILFGVFIWRGFYIGLRAPDKWSKCVVIGIMSKMAIQIILNIAVVTNTLPSTGVPLPFFSYGGTALLVLMAEMGLILNISKYSYVEK